MPNPIDRKYFDFLDALRESGQINMFSARPFLQQEFPELNTRDATDILTAWLQQFR